MQNKKLSIERDKFVALMQKIERIVQLDRDINEVLRKYNCESSIYISDSIDVALNALHLAIGSADEHDWISYFCWEMDFGREWEPGDITNKDGTDIPLGTADDLYTLLERELSQ